MQFKIPVKSKQEKKRSLDILGQNEPIINERAISPLFNRISDPNNDSSTISYS
jgi:hypothetical protein